MDFSKLKVAELKDELKARGLAVTGLKAELLQRLQEAATTAEGARESAKSKADGAAEAEHVSTPAEPAASQPAAGGEGEQEAPVEPEPEPIAVEEPAAASGKEEPHVAEKADVVMEDKQNEEPVAADVVQEKGEPAKAVDETKDEVNEAMQVDPAEEVETKADEPEDKMETGEMGDEEPAAGTKRKRDADEDMQVEEASTTDKKARIEEPVSTSLPIPSSLSHVLHPPTRSLFISNLRRPLQNAELMDYLTVQGEKKLDESVANGFWLDGIKSHCYITFLSPEDALEAAETGHGSTFPKDTGAELHVEFLPTELVSDFVEQEREAWNNGRQKRSLTIRKVDVGTGFKGGDVTFELLIPGAAGAPARRPAPPGAPTGPGVARLRAGPPMGPSAGAGPPPPMPFAARPGIHGMGGMPVGPGPREGQASGWGARQQFLQQREQEQQQKQRQPPPASSPPSQSHRDQPPHSSAGRSSGSNGPAPFVHPSRAGFVPAAPPSNGSGSNSGSNGPSVHPSRAAPAVHPSRAGLVPSSGGGAPNGPRFNGSQQDRYGRAGEAGRREPTRGLHKTVTKPVLFWRENEKWSS